MRLREITAESIEEAILAMQQMKPSRGSSNRAYSAKTINNTLTTLSVILGSAVNDGLLRQNPARRPAGRDSGGCGCARSSASSPT